jgi:hypothetical protein
MPSRGTTGSPRPILSADVAERGARPGGGTAAVRLYVFMQRYIVTGLTAGAVKG